MKKLALLFAIAILFSCKQKSANHDPSPDEKMLEVKENIQELENREDITEDQKTRKTRSEKLLQSKNIKINQTLPYIESEGRTTIRTPKEVAQRVTILAMTNLVAFGNYTSVEATEYLKKYHLWEYVTPNEKAFLQNPSKEAKNAETWKAECIWVLLWALKAVPELAFPNQLVDLNQVPEENYPFRGLKKDPHEFISRMTEMRSKSEILDACDLYYRYDWACVDARVNKEEMTNINGDVVYERHYALNWLVNYMNQEWDEITCDT